MARLPAIRTLSDIVRGHRRGRRPGAAGLMALAIDHRAQLEAMADEAGVSRDRITAFKALAVKAAAKEDLDYSAILKFWSKL